MQGGLGKNADSSQAALLWYLEYTSAFGVVGASAKVSYNILLTIQNYNHATCNRT